MRKHDYITYFFLYAALFVLLVLVGGSSRRSAPFSSDRTQTDDLILLWTASLSEEEAAEYLAAHYPLLSLSDHLADYSLCRLSQPSAAVPLLVLLNADPHIRLAEADRLLTLCEATAPDDPYFETQWGLHNTGSYPHYYGSLSILHDALPGIDLRVPEAWEAYPLPLTETVPVIVAVIDTGVDYRHPDLADHLWQNPGEIPDNGIDDDGNGYVDDVYGWDFYHDDATTCHYHETFDGYTVLPEDNDNHGTHCAGIIAATADNGIGIAGVASPFDVRIMSLKIHGGSTALGSTSNAIKAIRYAEQMGAAICNMSWGTETYSQALELVIEESSMLFVTAAGNSGSNNNSTPIYPAGFRLSNVISVAYIDPFGNLASDSNYGLSTVDLAAPGQDIYSTVVGGYAYLSGSSMAAPHVTGIAAMLYAYRSDLYAAQIKELLVNTIRPLDSLNGKLVYPGIPDALLAVQSLPLLQPDSQPPFLSLSTGFERDRIVVRISAFDAGGSGIHKVKYAYGTRNADYFRSDGSGSVATEDTIYLTKPGYYTFYAEDYAGNYTLCNSLIMDDTEPPVLSVDYTVTETQDAFELSILVSDGKSGVKSLKYLTGEAEASVFLHDGSELPVTEEPLTLWFPPETEALTFYALDYRGNSSCVTVHPRIIPSVLLLPNLSERSLFVSQSFELRATLFPLDTTDRVSFTSLDPSVVSVDETGLVTAIGEGEASLLISSTSGLQYTCHFRVYAAEEDGASDGAEDDPETDAQTPVSPEDKEDTTVTSPIETGEETHEPDLAN